jgi:hypothetical protein
MKNENKTTKHSIPVVSEKLYPNAGTDKVRILLENRDRSGIYLFTNKNTGQQYVGSDKNLSKILKLYYSDKCMKHALKKSRIILYSSILKHGLNNFSLEILEYCEPDKFLGRNNSEQYNLSLSLSKYLIAVLVFLKRSWSLLVRSFLKCNYTTVLVGISLVNTIILFCISLVFINCTIVFLACGGI